MTLSVSRRLLLWLAVPLALLALVGALANYFIDVAPVLRESEVRLSNAARALATRLRVSHGQIALAGPAELQPAGLVDGTIHYLIRDGQGRLVAGDARLPLVVLAPERYPLHATAQLEHRNLRALTIQAPSAAGPVTIMVAEVLTTSEPAMRAALVGTLLWDFVQLFVTLLLVWFGVRLGLHPLKQLRAAIAARSPQDLRPLLETSVPQEIQPLSSALNRLLATVRTSVQAQQQFIANTAHQLRTPIAGLSAQLELLALVPEAEPVKSRLAILQEGMRQLAHTTNQLLMLARADSAAQRLTPKNEVIDLEKFTTELVARFVDRAVLANIDLGVNARALQLRVDPSLLDDLLSNLVDNALKYTAAGGVVTVYAGLDNIRPFVEIDDTGRGIPESERARVRQRFYRSPESPSHGTGLGLAIVDEIARLYGAALTIGDGRSGRGTRVQVMFPGSMLAT